MGSFLLESQLKVLLALIFAVLAISPLTSGRPSGVSFLAHKSTEDLLPPSPDLIPVHPTQEVLARADEPAGVESSKGSGQKSGHDKLQDAAKSHSNSHEQSGGNDQQDRRSSSMNSRPVALGQDNKPQIRSSYNPSSTNRAKTVDREVVESLGPEEFLESESELIVDFIQEHANLVSALFGGEYDNGSGNAILENRILEKLKSRARRRRGNGAAKRSGGDESKQAAETELSEGDAQKLRDIKEIISLLGLDKTQDNLDVSRTTTSGGQPESAKKAPAKKAKTTKKTKKQEFQSERSV